MLCLSHPTFFTVFNNADRVSWSCFPAENHTWQAKPYWPTMAGKSRSAKEYIYVWFVNHYLDFDSVARCIMYVARN